MTTDVEIITADPSFDPRTNERTGSPLSVNVYYPQASFPDAESWEPVLAALAANLDRKPPREDLVFWIHELGNGEVSLGMTRPPGSNRQLWPLLDGSPVISTGHGNGTLADDPRPVLKWCAEGRLLRLWEDAPPARAHERLGGVPVTHRRYRVVGLPGEGGRSMPSDTSATMRIESVDIQNVKRFEHFEATFTPSFNVIIGDNGAGKTTILTLLRRVLRAWTPRARRTPAGPDFVRETLHVANGTPYRQPHHPWHLRVHGRGPDGAPFEHTEVEEQATVGNVRASRLHRAADADVDAPLPVLAYFSPWRELPRQRKPRIEPSGAPRRLDGYHDALDLHADFNDFAAWFKGFEMQRVEDGTRVPAVEAVRTTVMSCIPGCTELRWVPVLNDIIVTIDGVTHPIWRLSDGFRTMLALVGELAWRAAVLNPALGAEVARSVGGVVLIDELDLHLHPRWQRQVVADLRSAFPHVQFIATTHSPFIVQSMRADEVINLDRPSSLDFQRASIEDIAEVEMGLSEVSRSRAFHAKVMAAREYLAALEQRPQNAAELRELKRVLDQIQEQFGADPVYVASLLRKREARGIE